MDNVVIKAIDMNDQLKNTAFSVFQDAVKLYNSNEEIAKYIKTSFDSHNGSSWNCIVGTQFGAFVTHIEGNFIYFVAMNKAVLLFRTSG
ncbi:Dynein light chain [Entamoeba marina]